MLPKICLLLSAIKKHHCKISRAEEMDQIIHCLFSIHLSFSIHILKLAQYLDNMMSFKIQFKFANTSMVVTTTYCHVQPKFFLLLLVTEKPVTEVHYRTVC